MKLFYAAGAVDEFLLAGEKRVAVRTDFDADILLRGTRVDHVAAQAGDRGFHVLGMYFVFHVVSIVIASVRRTRGDLLGRLLRRFAPRNDG